MRANSVHGCKHRVTKRRVAHHATPAPASRAEQTFAQINMRARCEPLPLPGGERHTRATVIPCMAIVMPSGSPETPGDRKFSQMPTISLGNPNPTRWHARLATGLFLLLICVSAVIGYVVYGRLAANEEREAAQTLDHVADIQTAAVSAWVLERLGDATVFGSGGRSPMAALNSPASTKPPSRFTQARRSTSPPRCCAALRTAGRWEQCCC